MTFGWCLCYRVVLLLLSSGYIGLRIVALEEQLTSLGALAEFTLQSGLEVFPFQFQTFIVRVSLNIELHKHTLQGGCQGD